MNRSQWLWRASMACAATLLILSGCDVLKTDEFRWLAPDLLVRPPKNPRVSLIRRSITPADERTDLVPNATPPTEDDFTYTDKDYVLGPTDLIDVAIMDLYQVGVETTLRREVSDAGYIDLPLLPHRIKAQGQTQEELRETIKAAFSPAILRDPIISVSVVSRRQNMFSVLGAVLRGGTYNILRKDMRMLEALALVGDVTEATTRYIYVLRMMPVVPVPDVNAPRESAA